MKLSVIIIEYHCMEQVRNCIQSIREYLPAMQPEILILSNSEYSEGRLSELQSSLGDARVVTSGGNLGYAGGVNLALTKISGDYAYILNPDCLLTDDKVGWIIEEMEKYPDWAISGPKVVDQQGEVQPSCRRFPKPWTFLLVRSAIGNSSISDREKRRYFMLDYDRNAPRDVDWVSGGAIIVKIAAIRQIGGMDDRFFLYMEDVDWCRAAWTRGFRVVYDPRSIVIHAGKHQSIRWGWRVLSNQHLRWHIVSLVRYFKKYAWKVYPNGGGYCKKAPIN